MGNRLDWFKPWVAAIAVVMSLPFVTPLARAQAPRPNAENNDTSDLIKCWWKTDKNAVEVAEQFTLTLTCGVSEARGAKIIPKMEPLDPGAVQFSPFEVVSGIRHEDIQAPPWRYFQYEYTLRLIDDDAFGQDEDIPGLTVTYNVQSDVAGASAGRDQMYVLPDLPIRILSLVPKKATDIRDAPRENFAAPKARLVRATADFIAAGIFFGFSVLMLAFVLVTAIRRNRGHGAVKIPVLSDTTLVRACLQELGRVQNELTRGGWTPERAGSALTALRIGSAVAMGRPVSQTQVDMAVVAREGQLAVRKGVFKRERIVVSAPVTAEVIERYRMNGNRHVAKREPGAKRKRDSAQPQERAKPQVMIIDELGKSLITFNAVRYGRNGSLDVPALNRALESSRTALKQLLVKTLWPVRAAEALFDSADMLRTSVWTR
jgi:hypothetical protein